MIVTAETYRKLVTEDIEWLKTVPRTLERDHVLLILEHQVRDAEEIVKRDMKREREKLIDDTVTWL